MGIGTKSGIMALAGNAFSNIYSALYTGATNEKIDTGDSFKPSRSSSFSISAWVKYTAGGYGDQSMITSKIASGRGATFRGYKLQADADNGIFLVLQSNSSQIENKSADHNGANALVPAVDEWNHIVATYNGNLSGSGINIFVNGVSRVSQSAGGDIYHNPVNVLNLSQGEIQDTTPVSIGSRGGITGSVWDGNIDEFVFFNGDLAQSDVTALYNGGIPNLATGINYSKVQISIAHYYRMGDNDEGTGTTVTDQVGSANGTLSGGVSFEEDVPS